MSMRERLTPQSLEAEQSTLGAMMMEADAIARATEILQESDFYRLGHQKIFDAIVSIAESGEVADIVTVSQELRRRGILEDTGGSEYLSALMDACPSSSNVVAYIREVKAAATLRFYIAAADAIQARAYNFGADGATMEDFAAQAERLIMEVRHDDKSGDCEHVGTTIVQVLADYEVDARNPTKVIRNPCGFRDIDRKLGGLNKTHLIVLGARPSMGKSALALQMAYHVAKSSGFPVVIFSFEMSKEELVQRLACLVAQVNGEKFKNRECDQAECLRVAMAAAEIETVPLYIQDTAEMTTMDMRSRARRLEQEHGQLGLVVVDYLQIVTEAAKVSDANRAEKVGMIARQLHILGRERKCPVLALSQLSRNVEQREDKRPTLSDLRESGSIEAEANSVLMLYRDGYPGYAKTASGPARDDTAELIVRKNRGGALGTIQLHWDGPITRFSTVTYEQPPADQRGKVYGSSRFEEYYNGNNDR